MDVSTAVMHVPYFEARDQFLKYRALVKDRPQHATPDDVTLYRALWQIQRGQKVIDAAKAVIDAGLNATGLPRLALARAHWPTVHCWVEDGRHVFTREERRWSWEGRGMQARQGIAVRFPVPPGVVPPGRAQTPSIPPQHRPKGSLTGYHLLWEAEWQRVPPSDPILLRHIDGPFYVVLAQWDLSPLEQAVLRAKL